ncbi:hypothetical protein GMOD_00007205 [Pyrenophora seminiperda CCB06]|uniref:Uncharacterized protein n=1 Tax=Pyrenophora seminiperda CCB06 TaxID=1302712 RepID=A0A3M7MCJ2_9PLEO|nr:hypothetical protein GMOD_00007205 [Pyrenophora seminiperda CCB06]
MVSAPGLPLWPLLTTLHIFTTTPGSWFKSIKKPYCL